MRITLEACDAIKGQRLGIDKLVYMLGQVMLFDIRKSACDRFGVSAWNTSQVARVAAV